ncbi:unnamed protein product [Leuciscus chuanchicus]
MLDPQFGMNWAEMDVRTSGSATTIQNTRKELQKSLTDSLIAQAKKVDLDICEEPTEPTQDSPPNAKIPRLLAKYKTHKKNNSTHGYHPSVNSEVNTYLEDIQSCPAEQDVLVFWLKNKD